MEDTLQRVFAIIVSVIIFFLLPLYIAFEKKDDISYSLALKISTNFANDVKNKGYLTKDMYTKFISDLAVTDNVYDITFEHIAKKYNPVIYSYTDDTYKTLERDGKFDYNLYKNQFEENKQIIYNNKVYKNLVLAYELSEVRYTGDQILNSLEMITPVVTTDENQYLATSKQNIPPSSGFYRTSEGKPMYAMSKGDEFTVIIRNTNTTIASVLFNTLTFGANTGNDVKIYINYGGTIQNESYRETVLE